MENSISLGNLEVLIRNQDPKTTNIIDGCFPDLPLLFRLLPFLLGGFRSAVEVAQGETSDAYPYSKEELAKRVVNEVIPKLENAKTEEDAASAMKEIYFAFPAMREVVANIERELGGFNGGGSGGTIHALPIPFIATLGKIVVAYAAGHLVYWLFS